MISEARLTAILAGAAAALIIVAGIQIFVRMRRRSTPEELEKLRRLDVNRRGRITAGQVVGFVEPSSPASRAGLLVYQYEVANVTYEASQDVSSMPTVLAAARRFVGLPASVKYDPKRPTNSIVSCEEWLGVSETEPQPRRETPPAQVSGETIKKS